MPAPPGTGPARERSYPDRGDAVTSLCGAVGQSELFGPTGDRWGSTSPAAHSRRPSRGPATRCTVAAKGALLPNRRCGLLFGVGKGRRRRKRSRSRSKEAASASWPLAPCRSYAPKQIVGGPDDEEGRFFLALAVAYNDLKGLVMFDGYVNEYSRPASDDTTGPAAQWHGIKVQIQRWLAGVIYEVVRLLSEHRPLIASDSFKELLSGLHEESVECWSDLVDTARGNAGPRSARHKLLVRIRNNLAFHYYDPKTFAAGFQDHFSATPKTARNEFALASIGESMEKTRFYYADAASQAAMNAIADARNMGPADEAVISLTVELNRAIAPLLAAFLERRSTAGRM